MKERNSVGILIVKIIVALLALAGAVYVIVAFGDKIVAWFKKVTASLRFRKSDDFDFVDEVCEESDSDDADGNVLADENEFED